MKNRLIRTMASGLVMTILVVSALAHSTLAQTTQTTLTLAQAQALAIKTWGLAARMTPLSIPTATWRSLFCVGMQPVYPDSFPTFGFGPIANPSAGLPTVQIPGGWPEVSWKGCGANYTGAFIAAKVPFGLTAAFTVSPTPTISTTTTFDASSSICGVVPCSYQWTDDTDGSVLGNGTIFTFTFQDVGTKKIRLTIVDGLARSVTVEQDVAVQ